MDLKISNNLFLGLQELKHLKKSLKQSGYETIFKQMISSYGVVRPYSSNQFSNLQVIDSGLGQLTIKQGIAIDGDLNAIIIKQDLIDELQVPTDGIERFVVIKYLPTVIEEGTVDIQPDGSLVGTSTKFTSKLRGLPNFPSKITFPNSTNNVQQYTVQAVQSDILASLNVAGGQIVAENNQKYSVVGTFTPGIAVPSQDQYPFIGDGYVVELRDNDALIEDKEFLLAKVSNQNGSVSIQDQRITNIFNFLSQDVTVKNSVDIVSEIIACTEIKHKFTPGTIDSSLVKVEWGIRSEAWDIEPDTRKLTVFSGQGGTWNDLSQFSDDDFVGQYVVFEQGQSAKIIGSAIEGSEVTLELEYQSSYIENGSILIAPAGLVELQIKHQTKNFETKIFAPGFAGHTYVELAPGNYNVKYRLIQNQSISPLINIKENDYLTEQSFNQNGFVIAGQEQYETSQGGNITIAQSEQSFYTILSNIVFPGVIWDYFGNPSQIPQGWVLCDGAPINSPGSPFNGQNAPNLKGRVTVGLDLDDQDYDSVGNTGGSKTHTLQASEMPQHDHQITDPGHSHQISEFVTFGRQGKDNGSFNYLEEQTASTQTSQTGITVNSSGGGQSHENRQPYYVAVKIMKI